ncbi:MAG: imelysin family protein [Akkermansia sp.]
MKTTQTIASLASLFVIASAPAFSADAPKVQDVLSAYTQNVVIPTYNTMATNAVAFAKAANKLQASPSDANLAKAIEAWKKTTTAWEQSEGFLYGPAEFASLDPKLDSWPLDQVQLDSLLAVVAEGKIEVDAAYVRDYLGASMRGFHAAEYLMFRDGKARAVANMSKGEIAYLAAVATVVAEDCIQLEVLWNGLDSVSSAKKAILEAGEIEKDGNYASEIANAGQKGSRYDSQEDAIEEIIVGCVDIVTELAGPKFGEPFEAQDKKLFESWYSYRSLDNTRANIISVQNTYMGVDAKGNSFSALVAAKNPALDAKVKASFAKVFKCMDAFGAPVELSLSNKAAFKAVIAACEELCENIEEVQETLVGE